MSGWDSTQGFSKVNVPPPDPWGWGDQTLSRREGWGTDDDSEWDENSNFNQDVQNPTWCCTHKGLKNFL